MNKQARTQSEVEKQTDAKLLPLGYEKKIYSFSTEELSTLKTVTIIQAFLQQVATQFETNIVKETLKRVGQDPQLTGSTFFDVGHNELVVYVPPKTNDVQSQ